MINKTGKAIVFVSGKGGTGKTVLVSNLGAILAMQGYKVALVDMDLGLRNLDLCLGLQNQVVYDLADILLGVCKVKQALIRDKRFNELYLIPAPQYITEGDITPLHTKVLCEKLKKSFDYILIDAPAGIGEGFELAVSGADEGLVVTTPEYSALRDADAVAGLLKESGITVRNYIINKVHADLMRGGFIPDLEEIAGQMRIPLLGIIQEDENIHIAAINGIPVVLKEDTYIRKNFEKITDCLLKGNGFTAHPHA